MAANLDNMFKDHGNRWHEIETDYLWRVRCGNEWCDGPKTIKILDKEPQERIIRCPTCGWPAMKGGRGCGIEKIRIQKNDPQKKRLAVRKRMLKNVTIMKMTKRNLTTGMMTTTTMTIQTTHPPID